MFAFWFLQTAGWCQEEPLANKTLHQNPFIQGAIRYQLPSNGQESCGYIFRWWNNATDVLGAQLIVTNCSRTFSKLKFIKNWLQSTMCHDGLSCLALKCIEYHILREADSDKVINDYGRVGQVSKCMSWFIMIDLSCTTGHLLVFYSMGPPYWRLPRPHMSECVLAGKPGIWFPLNKGVLVWSFIGQMPFSILQKYTWLHLFCIYHHSCRGRVVAVFASASAPDPHTTLRKIMDSIVFHHLCIK